MRISRIFTGRGIEINIIPKNKRKVKIKDVKKLKQKLSEATAKSLEGDADVLVAVESETYSKTEIAILVSYALSAIASITLIIYTTIVYL